MYITAHAADYLNHACMLSLLGLPVNTVGCLIFCCFCYLLAARRRRSAATFCPVSLVGCFKPSKWRHKRSTSHGRKGILSRYLCNRLTDVNQILHSDKNYQVLFVDDPSPPSTDPRWRTPYLSNGLADVV